MSRFTLIAGLICAGVLAAAASPALAAFPGANGKILFDSVRSGGDDDIWTMSPRGGNLTNLTPDSKAADLFGNWRADGRQIVFMSNRETPRNPDPRGKRGPDFELFVMGADGSQPTQITVNELDDEDPAWSPDGRQIVFQRDFDPVQGESDYDLLTMNADGTGERNITNSKGDDDIQANWSSKGKIAFSTDRRGGDDLDIYTMDPDGSDVRKLTGNKYGDEFPNWSPDGETIAFHRERKGNFDVYTVRARGGGVQRRTTADTGDGLPAWSPDGSQIAFMSEGQIHAMRPDGGGQRSLTTKKLEAFSLDWQPQL